ncbi:hypothetical protein PROFUN_02366 [Planoprotostelium fungivorum]|uniref:Uncharacterized protein n=1 Tax=Planoprotostelium fungivorum TaxID=1890364 RepID=A0A2P6NUK7_9EUKA|nr:hypothetical protein PROFUN_02349 [Planoprotostelium fungivorum]PRP87666.1 hypothetical protein PROFUN_02366 [Planoprotostelium fungivorum]
MALEPNMKIFEGDCCFYMSEDQLQHVHGVLPADRITRELKTKLFLSFKVDGDEDYALTHCEIYSLNEKIFIHFRQQREPQSLLAQKLHLLIPSRITCVSPPDSISSLKPEQKTHCIVITFHHICMQISTPNEVERLKPLEEALSRCRATEITDIMFNSGTSNSSTPEEANVRVGQFIKSMEDVTDVLSKMSEIDTLGPSQINQLLDAFAVQKSTYNTCAEHIMFASSDHLDVLESTLRKNNAEAQQSFITHSNQLRTVRQQLTDRGGQDDSTMRYGSGAMSQTEALKRKFEEMLENEKIMTSHMRENTGKLTAVFNLRNVVGLAKSGTSVVVKKEKRQREEEVMTSPKPKVQRVEEKEEDKEVEKSTEMVTTEVEGNVTEQTHLVTQTTPKAFKGRKGKGKKKMKSKKK